MVYILCHDFNLNLQPDVDRHWRDDGSWKRLGFHRGCLLEDECHNHDNHDDDDDVTHWMMMMIKLKTLWLYSTRQVMWKSGEGGWREVCWKLNTLVTKAALMISADGSWLMTFNHYLMFVSWTKVGALPTPRGGVAGTSINGFLHLAGGSLVLLFIVCD